MKTNSKEHREHRLTEAREESKSAREIGPLRKTLKPARRKKAGTSLRLFIETYLAAHCPLDWSADHIQVLTDLDRIVRHGGQGAIAMPRGSGKSVFCRAAVLFAMLYGFRKFVVLIAATDGLAESELKKVKIELETNDLLNEDFPEVSQPLRASEGSTRRFGGQLLDGEPVGLEWKAKHIQLPRIKIGSGKTREWSPAAYGFIRAVGLTGSFRGLSAMGPGGSILRPDLVIVDDPQTKDSADSPTQTQGRFEILNGDVLGLAGPKKKIAVVVPCTVIRKGDLADQILNREKNPQWNGRRTRLVNAWPTNQELWDQYASIRRESLRGGTHGVPATEFYKKNQREMDAGADVPWAARFNPDELSAIQHAVNLRLDLGDAFMSEFQNEPIDPATAENIPALDADLLITRLTKLDRRTAGRESTRITAGIDVGGELLWYTVAAFDESWNGSILDYGTWPPQTAAYVRADDPNLNTLSKQYLNLSEEARIYQGLCDLQTAIFNTEFPVESSEPLTVSRLCIDSGYIPDAVHRAIREAGFKDLVTATKGRGLRPDENPMAHWKKWPGEKKGWNWVMRRAEKGKPKLCTFDTNQWKSFFAERLLVPFAEAGGRIGFFGDAAAPLRLITDHFTAEYRSRKTGRDRTVDLWELKPNRRDNHLWDASILSLVAASIDGLVWEAGALAGDVTTRLTSDAARPAFSMATPAQVPTSPPPITNAAPATPVAPRPNAPTKSRREPISMATLQREREYAGMGGLRR